MHLERSTTKRDLIQRKSMRVGKSVAPERY